MHTPYSDQRAAIEGARDRVPRPRIPQSYNSGRVGGHQRVMAF